MNKLVALGCGLLLALAGKLYAAETDLIDTNTPWRTYLVTGPSVLWQNDKTQNGWPSKGGGQLCTLKSGGGLLPFDPATPDRDSSGFSQRSPLVGRTIIDGLTAFFEKTDFSPRPPTDWMKPAALAGLAFFGPTLPRPGKLEGSCPRFLHARLRPMKQTTCCFVSSVVARCNGRSRPA